MYKTLFALILSTSFALAQEVGPGPVTPSVVGTSVPGQIPGTKTNNAASAGNVGETTALNIPSSTPVSLTSTVAANIATINITPGQWTVCGNIGEINNASTVSTFHAGAISTASNTLPADAASGAKTALSFTSPIGAQHVFTVGCTYLQVASNTPVYLVGREDFTVSTASMYGYIWAIRSR